MKKKILLIILIFFILFYLGIILNGYYSTETRNKPIIKDQLNNYTYLYNFYISNKPDTGDVYIGNQSAPIDVVVYLDPVSPMVTEFINKTYNYLYENYIKRGKVKYYQKYFITPDDYYNKTERYKAIKKLECIKKQYPQQFKDNYRKIMEGKFNVSDCDVERGIKEILSENVNYGIWENPRIYIGIENSRFTTLKGIPSERKLRRTLKNYEMIIGYER